MPATVNFTLENTKTTSKVQGSDSMFVHWEISPPWRAFACFSEMLTTTAAAVGLERHDTENMVLAL